MRMLDDALDWLFKSKTAEDVAAEELNDCKRSLVECESLRDYYDNMVNYHRTRITRLSRADVWRMDVHP